MNMHFDAAGIALLITAIGTQIVNLVIALRSKETLDKVHHLADGLNTAVRVKEAAALRANATSLQSFSGDSEAAKAADTVASAAEKAVKVVAQNETI